MPQTKSIAEKVAWSGRIVAVQPRIRLLRSVDPGSRSANRDGGILQNERPQGFEGSCRRNLCRCTLPWRAARSGDLSQSGTSTPGRTDLRIQVLHLHLRCRMPVEMIIDHWNPSKKQYRFETFCYGPKSCSFYRAGPPRKVPGRKGMSYTEENWVDEDATLNRGLDD